MHEAGGREKMVCQLYAAERSGKKNKKKNATGNVCRVPRVAVRIRQGQYWTAQRMPRRHTRQTRPAVSLASPLRGRELQYAKHHPRRRRRRRRRNARRGRPGAAGAGGARTGLKSVEGRAQALRRRGGLAGGAQRHSRRGALPGRAAQPCQAGGNGGSGRRREERAAGDEWGDGAVPSPRRPCPQREAAHWYERKGDRSAGSCDTQGATRPPFSPRFPKCSSRSSRPCFRAATTLRRSPGSSDCWPSRASLHFWPASALLKLTKKYPSPWGCSAESPAKKALRCFFPGNQRKKLYSPSKPFELSHSRATSWSTSSDGRFLTMNVVQGTSEARFSALAASWACFCAASNSSFERHLIDSSAKKGLH
mmetsp:Transcript_2557/g.6977  ORF Transcript_2557/g.6977 Transcript_2557/m.6977 type:complete len:365 (-) Transcript_2557:565-1659(-)